jgi:hypothetical protein
MTPALFATVRLKVYMVIKKLKPFELYVHRQASPGHSQRITTFGRDFAMASTLFHRATAPEKVGRMTQTWVRFDEGWRIVVGHVSVIDQ